MTKFLSLFISFLCLNISLQLDCSSMTSSVCHQYSAKYNLGCHWFSSRPTKCVNVDYDDGCTINESGNCVATEENPNGYECRFIDNSLYRSNTRCKKIIIDKNCTVDSSLNCKGISAQIRDSQYCSYEDFDTKQHCKLYEKTCNYYNDEDCGGLNKKDGSQNKQCTQLFGSNTKCREITVDNFCYLDGTCKKRNAVTDEQFDTTNNMCHREYKNDDYICHRVQKKCELFKTNNCKSFNANCYMVSGYPNSDSSICREVTVDNKCEINNSGKCVDKDGGGIGDIQKCDFDENYNNCKPFYKKCSEVTALDKCTESGIITESGFTCSKVEGNTHNCEEVQKDSHCEIKSDTGKCQIITKGPNNNNECRFTTIDSKRKCEYYQVDSKCKLDTNFDCNDGSDLKDVKKICHFTNDKETICQPVDKVCGDFTESDCDEKDDLNTENTKCSYYYKCQQYSISSPCTVTKGVCEFETGKKDLEENKNKNCIFNPTQLSSCGPINDVCENYYNDQNHYCYNQKTTDPEKKCVYIEGQTKCKEISVHPHCSVTEDTCKNGDSIEDTEKCYLDTSSNSCTVRSKTCTEYTDSAKCSNIGNNCYYISKTNYVPSPKCFITDIDEYCKIENGDCVAKNANSITKYQKCELSYDSISDKASCKRRDLKCKELNTLTENDCNSAPRSNDNKYQCFYISGSCYNVTLDGKCAMTKTDEGAKCSEDGTGKLSDKEICDTVSPIYNDQYSDYYCGVRNKGCSDFDTKNDCNNYSQDSPLCFNFGKGCQEVKIDSQCKIEGNECVGNGCSFDDEDTKSKCVYKKNNGSLLKLKSFILLALFFLF